MTEEEEEVILSSSNTLEEDAEHWSLHPILVDSLVKKEFTEFFDIQRVVIPKLLAQNSSPCIYPQDICVSAPTGSGKTLSYALPILNTLLDSEESNIIRHRLRALVLLPSRELAQQVYKVFVELTNNTHIKTVLTTGARSLKKEQLLLTGLSSYDSPQQQQQREVVAGSSGGSAQHGRSLVDIMISTPGRLLDHIHFTPGFTLQHLRFLVLDEADRLLGNAYHNWLRTLMISAEELLGDSMGNQYSSFTQLVNTCLKEDSNLGKRKRDESRGQFTAFKMPLQRLLFSATLSEEPAALALMGVKNPLFIRSKDALESGDSDGEEDWEENYQIPPTLIERQAQVDTKTRLLTLFNVLARAFRSEECDRLIPNPEGEESHIMEHKEICSQQGSICLIFVASVETSHRLTTLLQLLNGQFDLPSKYEAVGQLHSQLGLKTPEDLLFKGRVEEMSRLVNPEERESIVNDAAAGKVSIIVSTDRMARGIDLAGVKLVVNFDCPNNIKTYIHRAGRTARANRSGLCLTFLKKGQITQFKKMRLEASPAAKDNEKAIFPVKNLWINKDLEDHLKKSFYEVVKIDASKLSLRK
eukprot:gene10020-11081_t